MCRFVESIQLKNGQFKRLEWHQARLEKALAEFYPNVPVFDLSEMLLQSSYPVVGLFKCRVVFDSEIRKIEFVPYQCREIRSLKLVETDIESRKYKFEDRTEFNTAFEQRGACDDILLVKNGFLTDTSYCNIALYDGTNWFTPHIPLLYGVNRAQLLAECKLIEKDVKTAELMNFQSVCLFNALIEFGDLKLEISSICP